MKSVNQYRLTASITVGQLKEWMKTKDTDSKTKIVDLISHRFHNRYIKHLEGIDSGFLKMAVSCFMIETLESFKLGKKDTKGKGAKMFESFFTTEERFFPGFSLIHKDFYENVRCGILHQAETKNGWRIMLSGKLLNEPEKSINADKFVESLESSTENYIDQLKKREFTDPLWRYALHKLEDICDNCNVRV